jgi:hypothetical protein
MSNIGPIVRETSSAITGERLRAKRMSSVLERRSGA